MATATLIAELADRLWDADCSCVPIDPLTDAHPDLGIDDAYAMQTHNIDRRDPAGTHVQGRKVGLTSRTVQELRGVDEPDFGVLLDDMYVEGGDEISLPDMVAPRVEGEMAFILDSDLTGPGVTTVNAPSSTDSASSRPTPDRPVSRNSGEQMVDTATHSPNTIRHSFFHGRTESRRFSTTETRSVPLRGTVIWSSPGPRHDSGNPLGARLVDEITNNSCV